jgi:hypothetical protein
MDNITRRSSIVFYLCGQKRLFEPVYSSRIHRSLTDGGDKVNFCIGLLYSGTPGYMAGGPVRQPYAGVDFIPQSGIYEFGYCTQRS